MLELDQPRRISKRRCRVVSDGRERSADSDASCTGIQEVEFERDLRGALGGSRCCVHKQACNNERQMPTQAHVSRRRSAGASGLGEQHLLIQSIDSLAVSVVGRTRSYRRLNVNGLTSIVRRAEDTARHGPAGTESRTSGRGTPRRRS